MSTGNFVWFDLMSADPAGSRAFYTSLLGWTCEEKASHGCYPLFSMGGVGIGGIEASQHGTYWLGYVDDPDVDATAARATELGGSVLVPPTDVPDVGRFAVIADKQGAALAPMSFPHATGTRPQGPGFFCWSELHTSDADAGIAFWCALFGWTVPPDKREEYPHLMAGDAFIGGVMRSHTEHPSHWLHYVEVSDVDATSARAKELGAMLFVEPMSMPGVGRFAVVRDPQGGVFALFKGER